MRHSDIIAVHEQDVKGDTGGGGWQEEGDIVFP